jgi:hypothetical protein
MSDSEEYVALVPPTPPPPAELRYPSRRPTALVLTALLALFFVLVDGGTVISYLVSLAHAYRPIAGNAIAVMCTLDSVLAVACYGITGVGLLALKPWACSAGIRLVLARFGILVLALTMQVLASRGTHPHTGYAYYWTGILVQNVIQLLFSIAVTALLVYGLTRPTVKAALGEGT